MLGGLPRTPPGEQRGAEGTSQEKEGGSLNEEVAKLLAEGGQGGQEPPLKGNLKPPSPAFYSEIKEDVEKKKVKKNPPPNIEEKKEIRSRRSSKGEGQSRGASGRRTTKPPGTPEEMTYDSIPNTFAFSEGSKRTSEDSPTDPLQTPT